MNHGKKAFIIRDGAQMAQMRFYKTPDTRAIRVENEQELNKNTDRGDRGLGSIENETFQQDPKK